MSDGGIWASVSYTGSEEPFSCTASGIWKKIWASRKWATGGPLASITAVCWREMFFPCLDGSKLTAGPCHVDTAGPGCSRLQKQPSIRAKGNQASTRTGSCVRVTWATIAWWVMLFQTEHRALIRVCSSVFVLHTTGWYQSPWTRCSFHLYCTAGKMYRTGVFIWHSATRSFNLSPRCQTSSLLGFLDPEPAEQENTAEHFHFVSGSTVCFSQGWMFWGIRLWMF